MPTELTHDENGRITGLASTAREPRRYPLTGRSAHRPGGGHRINAAQDRLYWREWAAARRTLMRRGYSPADADEERHILHGEALGADKSHADFTNRDLDAVLDAFRAISTGAASFETGTRRRLLFSLRKLAGGRESYLAEICQDCYGHAHWTRLDDTGLAKLRATLAHRIERKPATPPAP